MTGSDGIDEAPRGGSSAELETDIELAAIVAVAENGVIGIDGGMPWHVPADLRRFKRLTTGHPVIVGRVTYESILDGLGEPLPDRTSIVLTRRGLEAPDESPETDGRDLETPENVVVANDLESALEAAERAALERHDGPDRAFVAGGATVYEQFLPVVDRLFVTEIHDRPEGDARFPEWDRQRWLEVDRDEHEEFTFLEYERR